MRELNFICLKDYIKLRLIIGMGRINIIQNLQMIIRLVDLWPPFDHQGILLLDGLTEVMHDLTIFFLQSFVLFVLVFRALHHPIIFFIPFSGLFPQLNLLGFTFLKQLLQCLYLLALVYRHILFATT